MPYTTIDQLPVYIRKYPEVIQRQWMHVWMTVYNSTKDESRAFQAANSVLKKRYSNNKQAENQSHSERFNHTINLWLGNLKG